MFLLLRMFNSIFFVLTNFAVTIYTLHRFFRAMKSHYELVDEVEEFSTLVDQSRESLEYVGSEVMGSIKEMESDIGKEVYVTHNLTALSAKIAQVSKRFNDLEKAIIQIARLNENMENVGVETPVDINDEVRRILKRKSAGKQSDQDFRASSVSPRKTKRVIENTQSQPNPGAKANKTQKSCHSPRSRSPNVVPEVVLLDEQRSLTRFDKPIGFRPSWMCPV